MAPSAPPNLFPNRTGEVWPDFYVVWTHFTGFWGQEVHIWGQNPKNIERERFQNFLNVLEECSAF